MKKRSKKADLARAHRLMLAMGIYRVIADEADIEAIGLAIGLALLAWANKHGQTPETIAAVWQKESAA